MGIADRQGEEAKPQGQHDDVEHRKNSSACGTCRDDFEEELSLRA
jgi:hypothetical protein